MCAMSAQHVFVAGRTPVLLTATWEAAWVNKDLEHGRGVPERQITGQCGLTQFEIQLSSQKYNGKVFK